MAVVELWYQGLCSSWLPRDYSVVAVETPSDLLLGVGAGDGAEVVATERLALSVTLSADHPPKFGGPLEETVRDAYLRLAAAAWTHSRADVATSTSEGAS
jgi:hypothetical protein